MEKYLITEKTIAIKKQKNKTIIYNVENTLVINKSMQYILEYNCNYYGSSLVGRKKSAAKILNIKYKLPILIEESKKLILLQLNSLRNEDCLLIMMDKIIDYKIYNKYLNIICSNKHIFDVKISINSFEKLFINAIKLNNILNWRKSGKYL